MIEKHLERTDFTNVVANLPVRGLSRPIVGPRDGFHAGTSPHAEALSHLPGVRKRFGSSLPAVSGNPERGRSVGALPRRGGRAGRALAMAALRALGWSVAGPFPQLPKAVIVVAPHTSNWDFVVGVLTMLGLGLRISWLGKHTLFVWPLRALMRWLGGVPVRRGQAAGVVNQAVAAFRERESMLLALSPEGTRKAVERWHGGFSRIASEAGVPVVPVALDWGRREVRIGAPAACSGDPGSDEAVLRPFFEDVTARRAECWKP